ncbi:MAG: TraB/GumN family protein [Deltaproteobacteria bacterium]
MSRRAALLAPLLFLACAHASPLERAQEQRSFLWRATMPGQPGVVYLLGSVHFRASAKLDKSITDAITKSDRLVFEVDEEGADGAISGWIAANGMLTDGRTLEDLITPATLERLTAFLGDPKKPGSLPRDRLVAMRPWMVTMMIPAVQMARNGIEAERGLDKQVRRFGVAEPTKKRELKFLETIQQQLEMLKSLEELDADTLVSEALRGVESGEVLGLIDLYESGDVAGLTRLVALPPEASEAERTVHRRTITDRNHAMFARIRPYFEAPGTTFVTVGAAHMVDREGLVQLLADEGAEFDVVPREGPASDAVLAVMAPKAETYRSDTDGFEIDTPFKVLRMNEGGSPSHVMSLGGEGFLMISSAALPGNMVPPYEAKEHAARTVIHQVEVTDVEVRRVEIAGHEAAVATGTKDGKRVTVRALAVPGRVFTFMSMWREGDAEAPGKVDAVLSTFRAK